MREILVADSVPYCINEKKVENGKQSIGAENSNFKEI